MFGSVWNDEPLDKFMFRSIMKLLEGRTIKNNPIQKPSMEAFKTSKEEIMEVMEEHQEAHDQECEKFLKM